jgi:hypothetical protein
MNKKPKEIVYIETDENTMEPIGVQRMSASKAQEEKSLYEKLAPYLVAILIAFIGILSYLGKILS